MIFFYSSKIKNKNEVFFKRYLIYNEHSLENFFKTVYLGNHLFCQDSCMLETIYYPFVKLKLNFIFSYKGIAELKMCTLLL
jgi:hypothetical protein